MASRRFNSPQAAPAIERAKQWFFSSPSTDNRFDNRLVIRNKPNGALMQVIGAGIANPKMLSAVRGRLLVISTV
jgi:hypothetical protein